MRVNEWASSNGLASSLRFGQQRIGCLQDPYVISLALPLEAGTMLPCHYRFMAILSGQITGTASGLALQASSTSRSWCLCPLWGGQFYGECCAAFEDVE
jgi:hypothetical protein